MRSVTVFPRPNARSRIPFTALLPTCTTTTAKPAAVEPGFFTGFDVVIASNCPPAALQRLSRICVEAARLVPLVSLRTVGFVGSCRLQVLGHCVVESHPERELPDLRLANPFPALQVRCRATLCYAML